LRDVHTQPNLPRMATNIPKPTREEIAAMLYDFTMELGRLDTAIYEIAKEAGVPIARRTESEAALEAQIKRTIVRLRDAANRKQEVITDKRSAP
jgi:glycerol-3-phosphate dehydrogenase